MADQSDVRRIALSLPDTTEHDDDFAFAVRRGVLVRLAAIDADELAELITDAWRCMAPKALVQEFAARGAQCRPGRVESRAAGPSSTGNVRQRK